MGSLCQRTQIMLVRKLGRIFLRRQIHKLVQPVSIAQNESQEISALQENLIIEKLKREQKRNNAPKNPIQAIPEKQSSKTERLKSCQEIILEENILVEKIKMKQESEQNHVEIGLPTQKYINDQRAKQKEIEFLTNLSLALKTENCEHREAKT